MKRSVIIYSPELGKHISIDIEVRINVNPEREMVNIEIPRVNTWVSEKTLMEQKI